MSPPGNFAYVMQRWPGRSIKLWREDLVVDVFHSETAASAASVITPETRHADDHTDLRQAK